MDLEEIRLFMRVVELGSVQRAALQFGVPRSSLRRKLESLEARVGVELLARSATGVELTSAGAVVLDAGRTLLEYYERMVANAKSALPEPRRCIRVVTPVGMPDVGRIAMMRVLSGLYPSLCVEEREYNSPLEHLHEPFDLMIHFGEAPAHGAWFSRVLRRARVMPLASEAYLQKHGRPKTVTELARHRLLSWLVPLSNPREWPLLAGGVLPVEPCGTSTNGQLMHRAAQEGEGIVLGIHDPTMHPTPTPLLPVLEDEVGTELAVRCLTPRPSDAEPTTRGVLAAIHAMMNRISAVAPNAPMARAADPA